MVQHFSNSSKALPHFTYILLYIPFFSHPLGLNRWQLQEKANLKTSLGKNETDIGGGD